MALFPIELNLALMRPYNKNGLLILCLSTLLSGVLSAQQTPYVGFYRQNWALVNPTAIDPWSLANQSGWHRSTMFSIGFRQQGLGSDLESAPRTGAASFEITPDVGVNRAPRTYKGGFTILKDQAAAISTLGIYGTMSYWWAMGADGFFHVGGAAGLIQYGPDRSKFQHYDPDDPVIDEVGMQWQPDFSIGVLYRSSRGYAGLSMPQTLSNAISGNRKPHIYVNAGRMINLNGSEAIFEPSAWLRWTPGLTYQSIRTSLPLSADLNARFWIPAGHGNRGGRQKLWMGCGTGTAMNLNMEAGIEILQMKEAQGHNFSGHMRQIRIGLAGAFPLSRRRGPLGNAIEITAAYAFN